jgi:hypothetical protein
VLWEGGGGVMEKSDVRKSRDTVPLKRLNIQTSGLREFETKFENILDHESWAAVKWFDGNN